MSARIGVFGASGSGKTTKALELIRRNSRMIISTPFADDFSSVRPTRCADVKDLARKLRANFSQGFKLVLEPTYAAEPHVLHEVSELIRTVQIASGCVAPILLVADELNTSFPVTALPADLKGFGELCSRGRHWNVSIIGITQRVAEVNTRWRGNMSGFYAFRQQERRDIAAVTSMLPPGYSTPAANFDYLYVSGGHVTKGRVSKPRNR